MFCQLILGRPEFGLPAENRPELGLPAETRPEYVLQAQTQPEFNLAAKTRPEFGLAAETRPEFGLVAISSGRTGWRVLYCPPTAAQDRSTCTAEELQLSFIHKNSIH